MRARHGKEDYIIETITLGNSMKVTAFDPRTLLEATIVAPADMPEASAAKIAVRKLHYLLGKRKDKA